MDKIDVNPLAVSFRILSSHAHAMGLWPFKIVRPDCKVSGLDFQWLSRNLKRPWLDHREAQVISIEYFEQNTRARYSSNIGFGLLMLV